MIFRFHVSFQVPWRIAPIFWGIASMFGDMFGCNMIFLGGFRLPRLGKSIEQLFMDPKDWCSNWLRWWNHRCCRSVLAEVYHYLTGVLKHVRIKRKYHTFQERLHHLRKTRSIEDMNLSWFIPKKCLTFGNNLFNDSNIQVQYRLQLVAPACFATSWCGSSGQVKSRSAVESVGSIGLAGLPPKVKWP